MQNEYFASLTVIEAENALHFIPHIRNDLALHMDLRGWLNENEIKYRSGGETSGWCYYKFDNPADLNLFLLRWR